VNKSVVGDLCSGRPGPAGPGGKIVVCRLVPDLVVAAAGVPAGVHSGRGNTDNAGNADENEAGVEWRAIHIREVNEMQM
jgi:anthranilate phosphoribosyltransferase